MLNNTMSIHDLIETLTEFAEEHGDDTLVVSSCDYGDITHTEQLVEIQEVEVTHPIKSGYSNSGYAYNKDMDPDDHDYENDTNIVIVLRGV